MSPINIENKTSTIFFFFFLDFKVFFPVAMRERRLEFHKERHFGANSVCLFLVAFI